MDKRTAVVLLLLLTVSPAVAQRNAARDSDERDRAREEQIRREAAEEARRREMAREAARRGESAPGRPIFR